MTSKGSTDTSVSGNFNEEPQPNVPLMDKGKRKIYEVSNDHHPFTEHFISTSDHMNVPYLMCTENWDMNDDNEIGVVSVNSMHTNRQLPSGIGLNDTSALSNQGLRNSNVVEESQPTIISNHCVRSNQHLHSTLPLQNDICSSNEGTFPYRWYSHITHTNELL
ncbi:hypothetical protein CTI12_AA319630 [Artemisia annua]|uniref:Uncharacterized protein n=1 Tax=Artemisia annua TaxID=35608 RepID=A0A2U1N164_ARTAN|nr:hypothetical protein CTI12_AA319630 [Artemisia annua]